MSVRYLAEELYRWTREVEDLEKTLAGQTLESVPRDLLLRAKRDGVSDNRLARLAIRYILRTNTVIPIPGMNSIAEVNNAVKAVAERRELDVKERAEIKSVNQQIMASLPAHYSWLKDWAHV